MVRKCGIKLACEEVNCRVPYHKATNLALQAQIMHNNIYIIINITYVVYLLLSYMFKKRFK